MKANFAVDAAGTANVLRKPKVAPALKADQRAEIRRERAWYAQASKRIKEATSIGEVQQIMAEIELRRFR